MNHTKNEAALEQSNQGRKSKKTVFEATRLKRKAVFVAVAMCFASQNVSANPSGANVVRGSATITNAGSTMSIANTPGAIIHWQDFSINVGETTVFNQINPASTVLNRVTGGNISQILGTLRSNGQVYLINPSGIVFGANAVVDVAGLVASTLNIKDADFIAGKKLFNAETASPGSVINHGQIRTPSGGFVYLLAPQVENNGIINTPSGEAILAAGNSVEIVDSVNPMQHVRVSAQSQDVNLSALMTQSNGNIFSVLNRGTVSANTVQQDTTGRIFFKSAGSIQTSATSIIEAKGDVLNDGGKFIGFADTDGFYAGKFDATGKNGGFIETSGKYLDISGINYLSAKALSYGGIAGTWLLDPYNIEITLSVGGNISGGPTFSPTGSPSQLPKGFIETALNGGTNVIVDTANAGGAEAGDITINASIDMTGSSDASLTFNADGRILMAPSTTITDSGLGRLSVTMLTDRDGVGAAGGITATIIDVAGDVSLTSNSGNFGFGGATASQVVRGANVNLDIDGNVDLSAGSLFNESVLIQATNGDVNIQAGGSISLLGGSSSGGASFASIVSSGDIDMRTQTGLTLTGGSGINSQAAISGAGMVSVKSGGDVVLAAGSGATGKAVIESTGDDVNIEFKSSGNNLNLTGGSGALANNFAVIEAAAGNVEIKGDISAHNPNINLTGGNSVGPNAYAVINARDAVTIEAVNISLLGGGSGTTNAYAYIGSTLSSTAGDVSIGSTGNIVLNAGGGTGTNSGAIIKAADSISIISKAANNSMTLTGGSMGMNNVAKVEAGGDLFFETNNISNSLNVTINGGGLDSSNVAGFSGNTISDFDTNTLTLNGGAAAKAYIATTNTTPTAFTIQAKDAIGNPASIELNGNVGSAEIGGTNGAVAVNIETGKLSLHGVNGVAGIGANTSNAVAVTVTSSGSGVVINGANARLGNSGSGSALVNVTANSNDSDVFNGIEISDGASIGSIGGGSVILNGTGWSGGGQGIAISNASIGSTNITLIGTGQGIGNRDGVFMNGNTSLVASGSISINGVGSASGSSAAGVSIADNTNINAGGNITISGTGQSAGGNSFGVVMFGSPSPTVNSSGGNVVITGTSAVAEAVVLDAPMISAANGSVSITASNNNISLGDAEIIAGNAVNLSAVAGNIRQTSGGSIVAPKLNARAIDINLGSLLNNFNSGLFATNNLFKVTNSASGTIDYEFSQAATVYEFNQDNATTLNITALNGLTVDGSDGPLLGASSALENLNMRVSDLRLINDAEISVGNNFRVLSQSLTMDSNTSISAGSNVNIASTNITMDNASISAGSDIDVITQNLAMTSSNISAVNNVNINSVPLAFKLAPDNTNAAQIKNIFNRLTRSVQIDLREGSSIFADNNTNVAGADVKLEGSEIGSGNITTVFSRNNIELTGGASEARIFAQNEVLLVSGEQVILNDGGSAAIVETDSPNTIFLNFPLLSGNGFVVNGVANAITNGNSGFFTGGVLNRTPAVLDTNLFVSYSDNTASLLAGLLNRNFNEPGLLVSNDKKSDLEDDDTNANSAKECS